MKNRDAFYLYSFFFMRREIIIAESQPNRKKIIKLHMYMYIEKTRHTKIVLIIKRQRIKLY